jgi:hypothetical protein
MGSNASSQAVFERRAGAKSRVSLSTRGLDSVQKKRAAPTGPPHTIPFSSSGLNLAVALFHRFLGSASNAERDGGADRPNQ